MHALARRIRLGGCKSMLPLGKFFEIGCSEMGLRPLGLKTSLEVLHGNSILFRLTTTCMEIDVHWHR